jgi:hypothetical protein
MIRRQPLVGITSPDQARRLLRRAWNRLGYGPCGAERARLLRKAGMHGRGAAEVLDQIIAWRSRPPAGIQARIPAPVTRQPPRTGRKTLLSWRQGQDDVHRVMGTDEAGIRAARRRENEDGGFRHYGCVRA